MKRLTEKEQDYYRLKDYQDPCKAIDQLGRYEDIGFSPEELQELIDKQKWHIVADGELPQKEDQYLVTISANGFVEVLKGFWKHGRMDFINEDGCYFDDLNLVATAWMKWPEPWEGVV